jgi:hypothetical protein
MKVNYDEAQQNVCKKYGVPCVKCDLDHKVGIAENVKTGLKPINGLRHRPEGDTTGWYIWAGEKLAKDPDFFVPLHVKHLHEWCPDVLKFLGLPPGWRFLISENYEDVWRDPSLL